MSKPFLVVTALLDSGARPAAMTRSHGDALERAIVSSGAHETAGLDLVELPVGAKTFDALRRALSLADETVALYDIFPLAELAPDVRTIAAQFLAAEALWALEERGQLGGVALDVKLTLPEGWTKDPKDIHQRLVDAGALALTEEGIEAFKSIKGAWDAAAK